MGHLIDLPGRLTATGGSKLTDCVYSLLTSIRVGLSSLPEHVHLSLILLDFSLKKKPGSVPTPIWHMNILELLV